MSFRMLLKDTWRETVRECCIDAKFVPAKKGGGCVGPTKCCKETKLVAITEKRGRSVNILITSASYHEMRLSNTARSAITSCDNRIQPSFFAKVFIVIFSKNTKL